MKCAIPEAALNQHIALLGKTGAGKTFCAKGIVEHLLESGRQVCILDPTAAWFGLRISADGKGRGFDVVLLGGAHADIPLAERSGAAVARLVTQQGASVVVDTSGFTVGEYTRWFIDFAGTLYTTIRSPLHLVIDEAHYFMPQGKVLSPDAGKMLHAGNRLMSGGRSLGVRGMLITQRPQKLHKDSLTCADTLIAMRVMAPHDRAAVKDWIDGAGDPAQGKTVLDSLAQLQRGEGWVWYPEGGYLERIKFPKIKTYDSSATPTHGAKAGPKVAEIKLDEVKAALAEAVKEAEANDPKLLRKEIAELRKQLSAKVPAAVDQAVDQASIERAVKAALAARDRDWERAVKERDSIIGGLKTRMGKAVGLLSVNGEAAPSDAPKINVVAAFSQASKSPSPVKQRPAPVKVVSTSGERLTKKQQQIIDAIAWWESIGVPEPRNEQVGAIALIDTSGGYFSNVAGPLVSAGLIERGGGSIRLTDAGRAAALPIDSVPTLAGYHDVLRERVRRCRNANGKTLAILDALIAEAGPLTNEQIGEAVVIDTTGGYFSNSIGPLSTLGLIERRAGVVTPTELVFPRGLN